MQGLHIEFRVLDTADAAYPYRAMTFPRFRKLLRGLGARGPALAVGAHGRLQGESEARPLGLALAYVEPGTRSAELMSLYVHRDARHRGLGTELAQTLEGLLVARGCSELATVYMTRSQSIPYLERILRACGWEAPQPRLRICRARLADILDAPWTGRFRSLFAREAAELEVAPWQEVTLTERARLRAAASEEDWIPADLEPFQFEGLGIDGSPSEPRASLVCRRHGLVIGWHLAHRINPSTVRFTCSFMRVQFRRALAMAWLWEHAMQASLAAGYENLSWSVAPHNAGMVQFTERFLAPYALDNDQTFGTRKTLGMRH